MVAAPIAEHRLGIPGKPVKYVRTEWHERVLRARYDCRSATIDEIERLFRVPRWVVRKWAQQMGLARTKERRWTEEDEEYLRIWLPKAHIVTIARRLRRTETAVALKARRLDLTKSDEGYTLRQLCVALGETNHHKIRAWVESGALKACRRLTRRQPQQGGDMWLFTDEALRAFFRRCPMEIDLRRVDQLWFMGIALGLSQKQMT